MWFKGLVSIACVAVIAAAGIFVWDRFYEPPNQRAEDCAYEREQLAENPSPETAAMDRMIIEACEQDGY